METATLTKFDPLPVPPSADANDSATVATKEKGVGKKRREGDNSVQANAIATAADWTIIAGQLRKDLGEDVYSCWFTSVEFQAADTSTVHLSVPTRFLKSWIQSNYRDKLVDLWSAQGFAVRRIDLTVRSAARPKADAPVGTPDPKPTDRVTPSLLPHARSATILAKRQPATGPLGGSPVDPRLSFGSFCEGATNQMALAAAKMVASDSQTPFNPLFIHAGVGRGKSHLLHASTQAARQANPGRNVVYLTAEHFMFRFVAAIRNQSGVAFKESLREIDLLMIDDVQFLQGKSAQQEFCHLLDVLIDGGRQVVVAGDRPPTELESLDERVRSRLGGGVAFEIGAPELELRRHILRRRYELARASTPGLEIPEAVLEYVAQAVPNNGRDLEGALNRLVAQYQFTNTPITVVSAEQTLRDLIGIREPRRVRIEDIQRVVSRHFNVSKQDLLSSRRTRTIVRPRQIAMYLSKMMTPRSLPEIGRRFGGRDHTTVLHAVRKIEQLMAEDRVFADEVELLRKMVEELPPG